MLFASCFTSVVVLVQSEPVPQSALVHARFGQQVGLASDLDGDHVPDLVVAAPGAGAGCGALNAVSGKTGKLLWHVEGAAEGDALGERLNANGDLDGDGNVDLLATLGASGPNEGARGVCALSSKDGHVLFELEASVTSGFQDALAIPDIDGDGVAEIVLTSVWRAQFVVRSGKSRALIVDAPVWPEDSSSKPPARSEIVVAALGQDADGDGAQDLVLAYQQSLADQHGVRGQFLAVCSTRTGKVLRSANIGPSSIDRPTIVSTMDLDGDGMRDVLYSSSDQTVELLSSRSLLRWTRLWKGPSQPDLEGFGSTSALAGDFDGDGRSEIVVGCGDDFLPGGDYRAVVYDCADGAESSWTATGYDHTNVFPGADLDGDGLPELLLGMPDIDEVWIIDGRSARPSKEHTPWWCQRVLTPKGAYVPGPK